MFIIETLHLGVDFIALPVFLEILGSRHHSRLQTTIYHWKPQMSRYIPFLFLQEASKVTSMHKIITELNLAIFELSSVIVAL